MRDFDKWGNPIEPSWYERHWITALFLLWAMVFIVGTFLMWLTTIPGRF